ncbi:MAG: tetratricopeptide repeat protein [Richelia sp. RM1_1_1]|nr:tetratricopeptide repeat protein [Richelia sp. RM1_1_1]
MSNFSEPNQPNSPNYSQEIQSLQQDISQASFTQDHYSESQLLIKLGSVYFSQNQTDQAFESYKKSIAIAQQIGERRVEALALLSLGWVYQKIEENRGTYKQMLECHHQCLVIAREISDRWLEASASVCLGYTYQQLKKYEQAVEYLEQGLIIAREIHDLTLETNSLNALKNIYNTLDEEKISIEKVEVELTPSGKSLLKELGIVPNALRRAKIPRFKRAQYRAVVNWLTKYQPLPEATNLERVRSYLEAFHHLCEIEDWISAIKILTTHLNTPTNEEFHNQLKTWGYYRQQADIYEKILFKVSQNWDANCLNGLANFYTAIGNYTKAIELQQQHLCVAQAINDIQSEGYALGNIGLNHYYIGNYVEAIEFIGRSLTIVRQIKDYRAEQAYLGNLGLAYYGLGNYTEAIKYYEQSLKIARNHQNKRGEGEALGNLGKV